MNWEQWDKVKQAGCELCEQAGGELIWQNEQLRVVLVNDKHFTGFTRVIWQEHVSEMTDLKPEERSQLMKTVFLVETIQREVLKPTKVNVASLGNITPHIHWHVIPRFEQDAAYPNPVWALSPEDAKKAKSNGVKKELLDEYVRALKIALWG